MACARVPGPRYNRTAPLMRDLNPELRGTFLVVIGFLVCLSVIAALILFIAGGRHANETSRPGWRTLPPGESQQPVEQPARRER